MIIAVADDKAVAIKPFFLLFFQLDLFSQLLNFKSVYPFSNSLCHFDLKN